MPSQKSIDDNWEKAIEIGGRNFDTWRRDEKGNVIRYGSYGTQGEYGWEIDPATQSQKAAQRVRVTSDRCIGRRIGRRAARLSEDS